MFRIDLAEVGGNRLQARAPGERQQVGDDAPGPRRLLHHVPQPGAEVVDPVRWDPFLGDQALHQLPEVQDAGEGIVDFVGHARGQAAEGCEALAPHEFLLRCFEFPGPLLDLLLQVVGEVVDLAVGRHQLFPASG